MAAAAEGAQWEHAQGLPEIGARLDRLASSRTVWRILVLMSIGGFFDYFSAYSGASIAPGFYRSHILSATTKGFFSLHGYAAFTAAAFLGLLIAASCFGILADRFGRRAIFTTSLLWFGLSGIMMAFQTHAAGLIFWRFMMSVGSGVETITIDSYLSEMVPKNTRGRAFAVNASIHSTAQPLAALAAFALVPYTFFSVECWRWVVAISCMSAIIVWPLRMFIPESPRWLAAHGRFDQADKIVRALEAKVEAETGRPLPAPEPVGRRPPHVVGRYRQIFSKDYLPRTIMLSLFHIFQGIGLFGFINWMPTFLVKQGVSVSHSLAYTLAMSLAAPLGPLACTVFADKVERKWQLAGAALAIAAAGLVLVFARSPFLVVSMGAIELLCGQIMTYNYHAYQAELFPTRIRTQAIGFVYSWSRVSGAFSGFLIAWVLGLFGVPAAFMLFTGSMVMVALCVGVLGPKTRNVSLEQLSP